MNPAEILVKQADEVCPECGGEIHIHHHEATFAIPECSIKHCSECDWEGEPE